MQSNLVIGFGQIHYRLTSTAEVLTVNVFYIHLVKVSQDFKAIFCHHTCISHKKLGLCLCHNTTSAMLSNSLASETLKPSNFLRNYVFNFRDLTGLLTLVL